MNTRGRSGAATSSSVSSGGLFRCRHVLLDLPVGGRDVALLQVLLELLEVLRSRRRQHRQPRSRAGAGPGSRTPPAHRGSLRTGAAQPPGRGMPTPECSQRTGGARMYATNRPRTKGSRAPWNTNNRIRKNERKRRRNHQSHDPTGAGVPERGGSRGPGRRWPFAFVAGWGWRRKDRCRVFIAGGHGAQLSLAPRE